MNKIIKAKKGHKFVLTELGFEVGRIASKYEASYPNAQYQHSVPESWLLKGYVMEVPENG